jgi:excisionase family DNA binding protein
MPAQQLQARQPVERLAYTIEDAVVAAGVGRSTLYVAMAARELKSLKVGKRRLIEADELRRWLTSHRAA